MSSNKAKTTGQDQLSLFTEEECKPVEIDTVYQYLAVLSPPEESMEKLRRLKYQLNNLGYIGSYNLFSIPHISLARMQSVRRQQETFGKALQKELSGQGNLSVRLNGFGHFEHGVGLRSLYLKLEEPEPVEALYVQLNQALGIPLKPYVPHLSLAKTITTLQFEELLPAISHIRFEEAFICDHILVLERSIRNQKVSQYKPFKKIRLA